MNHARTKVKVTRKSGHVNALIPASKFAKALSLSKTPSPFASIFRRLPGGVPTALSFLKMSQDEQARKVVRAFEELTKREQQTCRLEVLCAVEEVPPAFIIGEFARIAYETGYDMARFVAGVAAPSIMVASVALATEVSAEGTAERRMHLQASGFLPTPKGVTIKNQQLQVNNGPKDRDEATTGLPDIVGEQRARADRMRRITDAEIGVVVEDTDDDA